MPRGPRIDVPGLTHHVWHRGVGQQLVFRDSADCENLVARLRRLAAECGIRVYAWAFMWNHFHLVVQTSRASLGTFMARLMTGYARYFNERHGHAGHVFQNRYGSRVIEDEAELATVVVYVDRNPLEAGLVRTTRELLEYPWCSFAAHLGARLALAFECVGATVALFGRDATSARTNLEARVARGDPRVETGQPEIRASALPAERAIRFAAIARDACRSAGVRIGELHSGSRRPPAVDARGAAARRALAVGFTRQEIACEPLSPSRGCAVSSAGRRARRAETYARTSPNSTYATSHCGMRSSSPLWGSLASSKHTRTRWPTATSCGARFTTLPITRTPGRSSSTTNTTT